MQNFVFILVRYAGRMLMSSLVLFPALLLYVFVMATALNGSLTKVFLDEARQLIEGAPDGTVIRCINDSDLPALPMPQGAGESVRTSPVIPVRSGPDLLCKKGPVDTDKWVRSTDTTLKGIWFSAAVFGALFCFLFHIPSIIRLTGRALKKKENSYER